MPLRVKSRPVSQVEDVGRAPSPMGARFSSPLPDIGHDDSFRDVIKKASLEIVDGERIAIDLPLDYFEKPAFGRQKFEQTIFHKAPRSVNDDILKFNSQASSQWDGFRHFGECLAVVSFSSVKLLTTNLQDIRKANCFTTGGHRSDLHTVLTMVSTVSFQSYNFRKTED